MTQITERELADVVCPKGKGGAAEGGGMPPFGVGLGVAFLAGLWLGRFWRAKSGAKRDPV